MTVYEFLRKMGKDEKYGINVCGKDVTSDAPVSIDDVELYYEQRDTVLKALENAVNTVDINNRVIYCEEG